MIGRTLCHTLFVNYGYLAREIKTPVKVGHSFNPNSKIISPYPEEFVAVWDTGAMGTSISRALALKLGLQQSGEMDIEGVTGSARCKTYLVSLLLPNQLTIPELEVSDCEGNIGCDVLIGMDVIGMGDFAVCNKGGNTTFSFCIPSIDVIDFTQADQTSQVKDNDLKTGRNAPCICGSGKKYKKCCGRSA